MNIHPAKERKLVVSNLDEAAATIAIAADAVEACLRFPPAILGEAHEPLQSLLRDMKPLWKRTLAARKQVQEAAP